MTVEQRRPLEEVTSPEPEFLEDRLEFLGKTYPAIDKLFFTKDYWTPDPNNSGARLIPRKNLEWLLVPRSSMKSIVKKWKKLHPQEEFGRNVKGWGRHAMLTEKEAVTLLWFIHKNANTPQSRIRVQITTADSYNGPVYTQSSPSKRRGAKALFINETVESLIKDDDLLGLILKDLVETALLTAKEEVELFKRIEKGRRAEKMLKGKTNLSPDLHEKYVQSVEDGKTAREHMIKANFRLVISIAKRYRGKGLLFEDLIQEGNLGLMKSVEKFDYKQGYKFATYATWWIRQFITRAIVDQGRTIRIASHMHEAIQAMLKTINQFKQERGRRPSLEEITELTGHKLPKVKLMLRAAPFTISIETPVGDDGESELGDIIEDKDAVDPLENVNKSMLRDRVEEILLTLSPREARILRLRFGFYGSLPLTLEEVGAKFGLTRERIRQIEGKILRRLRLSHRFHELRDYYEL